MSITVAHRTPLERGLSSGRAASILLVLALVNLVSYAARNALFTVYPGLHARLGIDETTFGLLNTFFMIPHAAATLAFGFAGDRYDRRRVIAVGMALASAGGAAGALTHSYAMLALTRAVVGLGTAAVVPLANSIIGQLYEGPRKASRLALFNLGLFLGGVVGFGSGIVLGFPLVVIALAIPGFVLAAIVLALPVPPVPALRHGEEAPGLRELVHNARVLLRIVTLRWLLVSTTVMAFAAGAYAAWLKELLVREPPDGKGMSQGQAGLLLGLSLCAGLAGIITGARLSDRLRATSLRGRLTVIVLGMLLTAPCAAAAITVPAGAGLYVAGLATMFFISWYHAPMAATVDDLAPPGMAVSAQGLVIFVMHMLGTATSAWLVGILAKHWSLPTALWIPTGGLVIAALCMLLASRTFPADQARARGGTA